MPVKVKKSKAKVRKSKDELWLRKDEAEMSGDSRARSSHETSRDGVPLRERSMKDAPTNQHISPHGWVEQEGQSANGRYDVQPDVEMITLSGCPDRGE